jgi:GNAT superfamily N-acetyltransferase
VFVLPAHRDAGVGRLLLDAALAHADAHSYVRVVLHPSPRSVPFYERAGFGSDHPLLVRE